ncbi:MAG: DUF1707 domain-containing protein [Actinomycetes bacterium]
MTEDLPSPQPDPLADALRMRASDADRERVAGILRDAYAEGRLTAAEHHDRLEEAYRAQTYGELVPVMRDLPVPPGTLAIPQPTSLAPMPQPSQGKGGIVVDPGRATQGDNSLIAVFGGFERRGSWTVAAETSAVCVFGGGELDLTRAVLTSRETVINAVCIFGGLEITVPEGMNVRNEIVGILGGSEGPSDTGDPGAPVLVVKGAAIFGGVEIHRPR